MKTHRIAVLAGDGIGKEVIPTGIEVLKAAASREGFALELATFPWGCDFYRAHGKMMDDDGFERPRTFLGLRSCASVSALASSRGDPCGISDDDAPKSPTPRLAGVPRRVAPWHHPP